MKDYVYPQAELLEASRRYMQHSLAGHPNAAAVDDILRSAVRIPGAWHAAMQECQAEMLTPAWTADVQRLARELGFVRGSVWGAVYALLAWPGVAELLASPTSLVQAYAESGDALALLLLPAVIVRNTPCKESP
jgi:hypothetical protein